MDNEYWMRQTPTMTQREGTGNVTVHRLDGTTGTFENVRYDSNRMENGFLVMETDHRWNPVIFHVANVDWWEVSYV